MPYTNSGFNEGLKNMATTTTAAATVRTLQEASVATFISDLCKRQFANVYTIHIQAHLHQRQLIRTNERKSKLKNKYLK